MDYNFRNGFLPPLTVTAQSNQIGEVDIMVISEAFISKQNTQIPQMAVFPQMDGQGQTGSTGLNMCVIFKIAGRSMQTDCCHSTSQGNQILTANSNPMVSFVSVSAETEQRGKETAWKNKAE